MYHLHMICPFQHLFTLVDAFQARFAEVMTIEVLDYGPCRKSQSTEEAIHGFLVVECLQEVDEDLLCQLTNDGRILSLSEYCILSPASSHPFMPQAETPQDRVNTTGLSPTCSWKASHKVNERLGTDLSQKGAF